MQRGVFLTLVLCVAPTEAVFGDMYTWGRGTEGALGLGNVKQQNHPVLVPDMIGLNARSVDAGEASSTAVTMSGKVYMWGRGVTKQGKLDPKGIETSSSPVLVQGLDNIHAIQFTAGICHYAVLTNQAKVLTWGCNSRGGLGRGRICPECNSVVPLAVDALEGLNIRQLVSGSHHTAVLTDNGEVYVWGAGDNGEIGNGAFLDVASPQRVKALDRVKVCQICAGKNHMAALDTEGRVWTWGGNDQGQLGQGLNELRVAEPRQVTRFKYPDSGAVIGCGIGYTSVITVSNKVFLWGAGGQPLPTEKRFFSDAATFPRAVAAGANHFIVITKDYKAYSWGANYQGQLGYSDVGFYTNEPQLIEELSGKFINIIVAGANHTIALSGKPFTSTCPFFQDWFGSAASSDREFASHCHKEDTVCLDGTCCHNGESCALFADGRYGCCAGSNMRIVEDGKTCCPVDTDFNSEDGTCERHISYADAARIMRHFEDGSLRKLEKEPAAAAFTEGISHEGEVVNVVDETLMYTTATVAEKVFAKDGFVAAANAVVSEYHKLAAEQAHANVADSLKPPPSAGFDAIFNGEDGLQPSPNPEDDADEERVTPPITEEIADMSRAELEQEILDASNYHGLAREIKEFVLSVKSEDELKQEVAVLRVNRPVTSESEKRQRIDENGVTVSGPSTASVEAQERAEAERLLAELAKLPPEVIARAPTKRNAVEPTQTVEWIANMKLSERVAGLKRGTLNSLMATDSEEPPREQSDVVPGASNVISRIQEVIARAKNAMLIQSEGDDSSRPGRGPCPRSAGNLDCNRDCAEEDAKVMDQIRLEDAVLDKAARDAAETVGAGYKRPLKTMEELLTRTASPSPSPSTSWASLTIVEDAMTIIQEGNLKIAVDSVQVHLPPIGFYKDPDTNSTFKIVGDRVVLAFPGSRFVSMSSHPGSANKGHCGASRPTCPDNSCCEEHETCCQQQDGSFGCCPFGNGMCCSDRRHCCPEPYSCDMAEHACVYNNGSVIGLARFEKVTQGLCSANERACKDGSCCELPGSCCQMYDGLQGCAPFADAVCCSDGKHACPDGTSCNTKTLTCVDSLTGLATPITELKYTHVPSGVSKVCYPDEVTCSAGSCCNDENTCCASPEGYEECCPYTDAVCCSNGQCCPNGFECDTEANVCKSPEGNAEMKITMPGRAPYLVADVCSYDEYSCPGSHNPTLCCPKGQGCCTSTVLVHDQPQVVNGCCPYGEDAVCCGDGFCCPHRHTCDEGSCIPPDGTNVVVKLPTLSARQSPLESAKANCLDSRQLQDKVDEALSNMYGEVKKNCTEPGNGTMMTTIGKPDVGQWASEEDNAKVVSAPGEAGLVQADVKPTTQKGGIAQVLKARREAEQIIDLLDYLRLMVTQLMRVKVGDLCTVQGELEFSSCVWNDAADSRETLAVRKSLAEAAEVDERQVIVSSRQGGPTLKYMIDPNPDKKSVCKSIQTKLKTAILSGFLGSTLTSQGFECGSSLVETNLPSVVMDPAIDLNAKLNIVDSLHRLFGAMILQNDHVGPDIIKDPLAVKDLLEGLIFLREELSIAVRRDVGDLGILLQEKALISTLEDLITLIMGYLRTNEYDPDTLGLNRFKKPGVYDRVNTVRAERKCERLLPNEQPGPGCESTQMSLANMPLRDMDSERFDPVLQRQIGLAFPATTGSQPNIQQPPTFPVVDHVPFSEDKAQDFWMPEDASV